MLYRRRSSIQLHLLIAILGFFSPLMAFGCQSLFSENSQTTNACQFQSIETPDQKFASTDQKIRHERVWDLS